MSWLHIPFPARPAAAAIIFCFAAGCGPGAQQSPVALLESWQSATQPTERAASLDALANLAERDLAGFLELFAGVRAPVERVALVRLLADARDDQAGTVLEKTARSTTEMLEVRAAAAGALARRNPVRARALVADLLPWIRRHPSPTAWIGVMALSRDTPSLLGIALDDAIEPGARNMAIAAIGDIGDKMALLPMLGLARSQHLMPLVRHRATRVYALLAGSDACPVLRDLRAQAIGGHVWARFLDDLIGRLCSG